MPSPLIQQLMGNAQQNQQNALAGSIDMANQAGANRYAAQQQLLQMQHEFDLSKMAQAHQYGMESDAQKQAAMLADAQGKLLDRPVTPGGTTGLKYGLDPATGQINASTGKTDAGLLNTPFETAADPAALGQQMATKFNTEAATKATTPQQAAAPTMDHFAALGQAMSGNPFGAAASALQGSKEGDAAFLQNKQAALPDTIGYMSSLMRPTGTALDKEGTNRLATQGLANKGMLDKARLESGLDRTKFLAGFLHDNPTASPEQLGGIADKLAGIQMKYGEDRGMGGMPGGSPTGPPLPAAGGLPVSSSADALLSSGNEKYKSGDYNEDLAKAMGMIYPQNMQTNQLGSAPEPDAFAKGLMNAMASIPRLQDEIGAKKFYEHMQKQGFGTGGQESVERELAKRIAQEAWSAGDFAPNSNEAQYGPLSVRKNPDSMDVNVDVGNAILGHGLPLTSVTSMTGGPGPGPFDIIPSFPSTKTKYRQHLKAIGPIYRLLRGQS